MSPRMRIGAVFALAGLSLAGALGLGAPAAADAPGNIMRVDITRGGESPMSHTLDLSLSKTAIIELPEDAHDVVIANPEIADAIIRTPRRVYVLGVAVGSTNAFFSNENGDLLLNLEIRVERDLDAVQEMIDRLLPDARVQVDALNDQVVLTGMVGSTAEADRAVRIARSFVENPEHVISMLSISGGEQVLLRVRIVEMQRTIARQLGVNLNASLRFTEDLTYNIATNNEFSLVGQSLGGLTGTGSFINSGGGDIRSADTVLQALERVGLVRTLAEPNITAISGESAEFLAGGEFPVPVGLDNQGNIIIEYKPFGVGLSFTPMVLSDGRISLFVSTEVSELTSQGSIDLSGGAIDTDGDGVLDAATPGLTLPALNVRRAQTTVEMPSGGSLVMAGLIQDTTRQNIDGAPGARNIPGIGALFRARDYESQETELVVLVTPYLVDAVHPDALQTPADGYATPSEVETIFFGRLSRVYQAPGADLGDRRWRGPAGFILDDTSTP